MLHTDKFQQIENNLRSLIESTGEAGKNIFERMRNFNVPDISIALFEGDKIWTCDYSQSSQKEQKSINNPNIFQAASISKTINTILALKLLVETKCMDLDKDVNPRLKDWKIPGDTFKEKVTLRRLLSHAAGLSVSGFPGYPSTNKKFPSTIEILKGNESLKNVSIDELEEKLPFLPDGTVNTPPVEIVTEPGSQMTYSGGGIMIIQKLIEDITGKSYAILAKEHIFDPLGMTSSSFELKFPANSSANVKKAHSANGEPMKGDWCIYPESAAAGLWTTTTDLAKFAIAVQKAFRGKDNKLLSKEIATQMLSPQPNSTCGLGFFIFYDNGEKAVGHSGSNQGFQCDSISLLDKNAGVIIMTNSDNGMKLIDEIMCGIFEIYQWPGKPYKVIKPIEIDPVILKLCQGDFVVTTKEGTGKVTVTIEHGQLVAAIPFPRLTSETKQQFELLPESNTIFYNPQNSIEISFNEKYDELSFFGLKASRVQSALSTVKIAKGLGIQPVSPLNPEARQETNHPPQDYQPIVSSNHNLISDEALQKSRKGL